MRIGPPVPLLELIEGGLATSAMADRLAVDPVGDPVAVVDALDVGRGVRIGRRRVGRLAGLEPVQSHLLLCIEDEIRDPNAEFANTLVVELFQEIQGDLFDQLRVVDRSGQRGGPRVESNGGVTTLIPIVRYIASRLRARAATSAANALVFSRLASVSAVGSVNADSRERLFGRPVGVTSRSSLPRARS